MSERRLLSEHAVAAGLVAASPDAVLIANDERHYVDANEAACALLGRTREEVLRLQVDDLAPDAARPWVADAWAKFREEGSQSGAMVIERPDGDVPAILRRSPPGYGSVSGRAAGLDVEAELMRLAYEAGVPSPQVLHVLTDADGLGAGFVMRRVDGETIPRKILRDAEFATARPKLARQIGSILAGLHGIDSAALPPLRRALASKGVDRGLIEEVGCFPTKELVPYQAGFLAGWVMAWILGFIVLLLPGDGEDDEGQGRLLALEDRGVSDPAQHNIDQPQR